MPTIQEDFERDRALLDRCAKSVIETAQVAAATYYDADPAKVPELARDKMLPTVTGLILAGALLQYLKEDKGRGGFVADAVKAALRGQLDDAEAERLSVQFMAAGDQA